MTRIAQARPYWLAAMITGSAAILLFASSAAWAGSGYNDYDRTRSGRYYDSHDDHSRDWSHSHKRHHHASHKRHHKASHKRNHYRGRRLGHEIHHAGHYCRPCNRYFDGRDQLYVHVADRHRIPYQHLEVAVSFGEFGWLFFGG